MLIVLLALGGCELEKLPTVAGEHVVYHWDADEDRLCGGTVPAMDRYFELMTGHYGWPTSERRVEYFWDAELARSMCSRWDKPACATRFSTGTIVRSDRPLDTHELGHTTRVGAVPLQEGVNFIEEGFATRWQSPLIELTNTSTIPATFLSEPELRAALDTNNSDDFSYAHAFTWWLALELEYGPAKMSDFVTQLEGATSADDVEAALRRVFGISLAESAALAEALPQGSIDDPACALDGLPTFTWTGAPLVVERDDPACADEDIINHSGQAALWLFVLDSPDTPTPVEVSVTVPAGEDPLQKWLELTWCRGEYRLGELPPTRRISATLPDSHTSPMNLRGRHVGALRAPIEADGSVALPRVVFREAPP